MNRVAYVYSPFKAVNKQARYTGIISGDYVKSSTVWVLLGTYVRTIKQTVVTWPDISKKETCVLNRSAWLIKKARKLLASKQDILELFQVIM